MRSSWEMNMFYGDFMGDTTEIRNQQVYDDFISVDIDI